MPGLSYKHTHLQFPRRHVHKLVAVVFEVRYLQVDISVLKTRDHFPTGARVPRNSIYQQQDDMRTLTMTIASHTCLRGNDTYGQKKVGSRPGNQG